jgi:hypothetical protein
MMTASRNGLASRKLGLMAIILISRRQVDRGTLLGTNRIVGNNNLKSYSWNLNDLMTLLQRPGREAGHSPVAGARVGNV